MKTLSPKSKEVAAFESDVDVTRIFRQHKFWVSRIPLPQFSEKDSRDSVYPIACDPKFDLRTQTVLAERALHALGYQAKEIRKNVMVTGMAPRFILGVSQQGFVLYNVDKGLLVINLTRTQLPDGWTP